MLRRYSPILKGKNDMVREIVTDIAFLRKRSAPAARADLPVAKDLRDTLAANRERCIGMAANMIGVSKRIIIVNSGLGDIVMIDPVITSKEGRYEAEEGCLSLAGTRKAVRWQKIEVRYLDERFEKRTGTFSGLVAQTIQHECDHLNGVII